VTFNVANPARVDITLLSKQMPDGLVLHQNYHPSWQLYANTRKLAPESGHGKLAALFDGWFETMSFLWKRPISAGSHGMAFEYANAWHLSKEEITSATGVSSLSSENHSPGPAMLTFFYWPQALFLPLAAVSVLFMTGYFFATCAIHFLGQRRKKRIENAA